MTHHNLIQHIRVYVYIYIYICISLSLSIYIYIYTYLNITASVSILCPYVHLSRCLFFLFASKAMKTARGICVSRIVLAKRCGQRGERMSARAGSPSASTHLRVFVLIHVLCSLCGYLCMYAQTYISTHIVRIDVHS